MIFVSILLHTRDNTQYIQIIRALPLEAKFEDVLERKNVAKCQVYNFYVERFWCLHVKFGDPRAASFGFRESATQIQKMHTKSDVFRALFEQDIGWIKPCVCNRNWRGIWILQISYWPISKFIHKFWRSLGLKSRVQKRKEQNTTENRAARAYPWPASSVDSRVNSKHSTHPTCRRTAHQALAWGGQSWGGANSNKNHRETVIFNLPSFSAFARAVFSGEIGRGCMPSFKFLEHTASPHH